MNSLPAKIRNGDQFCIERNGDGLKKRLQVLRFPEQEPTNYYVGRVTFVKSRTCIDVTIPGNRFQVIPKWDNNTSSCHLHVGTNSSKYGK